MVPIQICITYPEKLYGEGGGGVVRKRYPPVSDFSTVTERLKKQGYDARNIELAREEILTRKC